MASRSNHPIQTAKSETEIQFARATGAGAADMTALKGDLVTATRASAGLHNVVFRHAYPEGVCPEVTVRGTTAGLKARVVAWSPTAKTMQVQLEVGAVATDAAAGDTVDFKLWVRNSGRGGF